MTSWSALGPIGISVGFDLGPVAVAVVFIVVLRLRSWS